MGHKGGPQNLLKQKVQTFKTITSLCINGKKCL